MSKNIEILEEAIYLAECLRNLLEKELEYDRETTDEVQNIIDALEYDLDDAKNG